uniref:Ribosomal protein L14 n=1 Tax=Cavenderia fasciculata TaxID=261658 RepID=B2XX98_CACFS|nr:ribosomal protein L14 [Cavenderia fasciculata]ABX45220.1 ribosomal protein L14 [Cavenderia fasciculata]
MIIKGSYMNVVDNTGAGMVQCIQLLKKKQTSRLIIGDLGVVVVKGMDVDMEKLKVKKHDVVYGIIIRTKQPVVRNSGIVIKNNLNGLILLNKKCEPLGSRIVGIIFEDVAKSRYLKTLVLSKHLI